MSTVLVVDDEPIVRDVVVRYLERDGHKTLTAASGGEAQRLLEPLGSTTFSGTPDGAEDARLDPDGDSLWVVETGAHAVGGFAVRGGHLTQLASSPTPLPAGATAFGMVVT